MPDHDKPAFEGNPLAGVDARGTGVSQGLCWSWELDFEALQAVLDDPAPWNSGTKATGRKATGADGAGTDGDGEEDQEALLDAILAAGEASEIPIGIMAGRIAEGLPVGPALAGWLATAPAAQLEDGALAGVAASWRRLASWAQAGELATVAQIASRSAARDDRIGVDADGRPARIPDEAAAQVSLALVMSQFGASWWTDLAVTLAWRLAATGAALSAGQIDLIRARLIADATVLLDDDTARAVEERVLPDAGELTSAALRAALRRAVIAADPEGAERRRKDAEARAKVNLYADDEGTATLSGCGLPGVRAAAAMARISALARAMKASGAGGGIDLLRAQVFLGLLCGTLPLIPPVEGAPPDDPPPGDPSPGDPPSDEDPFPGDGPGGGQSAGAGPCDRRLGEDHPDEATAPFPGSPWEGVPDPTDLDAPDDSEPVGSAAGDDLPRTVSCDDEDKPGAAPVPDWPALPVIPAAFAAHGPAGPRVSGMLDLTLPWATLAGISAEPGHLGRLGPITPPQASQLAYLAAGDPATQWRVILTNPAGQAIAVTRVPRSRFVPVRAGPAPERDSPGVGTGLVSRVTLTISGDVLTRPRPPGTAQPGGILGRTLRAAARAAVRAAEQAAADTAAGGCAHAVASAAYRPPPRLKEYVTARDLTCRFLSCRQPAWRGDLDHTRAYQDGGLTCACNLGGLCRTHHILKQHPDWRLIQSEPGIFRWITPTGRIYTATPDIHPA